MKTIDERLDRLAYAVSRGASNPPLIVRANRIADDMEAERPELAARLRVALTTRWESLGNRYTRIRQIRREWQQQPPKPLGPDRPADHDYEPGDQTHPMYTDPDCRICGGRKH